MGAKEKLIGVAIIIIGAYPLLLNIKSINEAILKYPFLSLLNGGQPVYQIILLILGVLLIWKVRRRIDYQRR